MNPIRVMPKFINLKVNLLIWDWWQIFWVYIKVVEQATTMYACMTESLQTCTHSASYNLCMLLLQRVFINQTSHNQLSQPVFYCQNKVHNRYNNERMQCAVNHHLSMIQLLAFACLSSKANVPLGSLEWKWNLHAKWRWIWAWKQGNRSCKKLVGNRSTLQAFYKS